MYFTEAVDVIDIFIAFLDKNCLLEPLFQALLDNN